MIVEVNHHAAVFFNSLPTGKKEDRATVPAYVRRYLGARMRSCTSSTLMLSAMEEDYRSVKQHEAAERILRVHLDRLMPIFNTGVNSIVRIVEHRTMEGDRLLNLDLWHFNDDVMDMSICIDYQSPWSLPGMFEVPVEEQRYYRPVQYQIRLTGIIPQVEEMTERAKDLLGTLLSN